MKNRALDWIGRNDEKIGEGIAAGVCMVVYSFLIMACWNYCLVGTIDGIHPISFGKTTLLVIAATVTLNIFEK